MGTGLAARRFDPPALFTLFEDSGCLASDQTKEISKYLDFDLPTTYERLSGEAIDDLRETSVSLER